jgi:addiction module HigA family antidote
MDEYIVAPGKIIKEYLDARGIIQKEVSKRTGVSERHLSRLVNGKAGFTADMAVKLEKVMPDVPASYWLNYEMKYKEYLARKHKEAHPEDGELMSDKLLSCPFCGSEASVKYAALVSGSPQGYWVCCDNGDCRENIECSTYAFDTEAEAVKAWNIIAERTCHIEVQGTWLYCSSCHACVNGGYYTAGNTTDYHSMRFCLSCGARVVKE